MICPNCKSVIANGDVFCRVCGTKVVYQNTNEQPSNMVSNNYQNSQQPFYGQANINENQVINDDELIDAYIGNRADKMRKVGFLLRHLI